MVEPEFYVPIIPLVLVNGISGIGTGFSSSIPSYNPKQIIGYLKAKLTGRTFDNKFVPYYEGFKGTVTEMEDGGGKFLIKGTYEKIGTDKIKITELPVGTWTMPYTTFLESLMDGGVDKEGKKIPPVIKDFVSMCTEVSVDFTITMKTTADIDIEKMFKLTTTVSNTNMHLFNSERRLTKYSRIDEIIDAFYDVRMGLYGKRKEHLVKELKSRLSKLTNKARYIQETLSSVVDLRKKTAPQVQDLMLARKFDTFDGDYKYLIKMPMDSVTEENVANILADRDAAQKELDKLMATPLTQMWLDELDVLDREYDVYKAKREQIQSGVGAAKMKVKVKKVKA
jgi:DNA topoisomerase-2